MVRDAKKGNYKGLAKGAANYTFSNVIPDSWRTAFEDNVGKFSSVYTYAENLLELGTEIYNLWQIDDVILMQNIEFFIPTIEICKTMFDLASTAMSSIPVIGTICSYIFDVGKWALDAVKGLVTLQYENYRELIEIFAEIDFNAPADFIAQYGLGLDYGDEAVPKIKSLIDLETFLGELIDTSSIFREDEILGVISELTEVLNGMNISISPQDQTLSGLRRVISEQRNTLVQTHNYVIRNVVSSGNSDSDSPYQYEITEERYSGVTIFGINATEKQPEEPENPNEAEPDNVTIEGNDTILVWRHNGADYYIIKKKNILEGTHYEFVASYHPTEDIKVNDYITYKLIGVADENATYIIESVAKQEEDPEPELPIAPELESVAIEGNDTVLVWKHTGADYYRIMKSRYTLFGGLQYSEIDRYTPRKDSAKALTSCTE